MSTIDNTINRNLLKSSGNYISGTTITLVNTVPADWSVVVNDDFITITKITDNSNSYIGFDMVSTVNGGTYTFSMDIQDTGDNVHNIYALLSSVPVKKILQVNPSVGKITTVSGTFKTSRTFNQICFRGEDFDNGEAVNIRFSKLEKGTVVTAWLPAPEELDTTIKELKRSIDLGGSGDTTEIVATITAATNLATDAKTLANTANTNANTAKAQAQSTSDALSSHLNAVNPHGISKATLDLDKVENLSSTEIINTLTSQKIIDILGYTPGTGSGGGTVDLTEVNSRISATESDISVLETAVSGLNTKATNTDSAITSLQSLAQTAKTTADAAKTSADNAVTTSNTASSTATTASNAAATAQSTANSATILAQTAKDAADAAQSTANTAKLTADTAKSTADTAKTTADNASSAATTAGNAAATAQSTANTASNAAATAKSAADTAQARADNAYNLANTANTAAGNAQTTADTAGTTATTALNTANTAKTTADTAKSTIDNANLVGGNLLTGTAASFIVAGDGTNAYTAMNSNTYLYNAMIANGVGVVLTPNQAYTVSFDYTLSSYATIDAFSIGYGSTIGTYTAAIASKIPYSTYSTSVTGHVTKTFTYTGTGTVYFAMRVLEPTDGSTILNTKNITISNLKLEKGSAATSWTFNPVDLQPLTTTANTAATNASTALTTANTAKTTADTANATANATATLVNNSSIIGANLMNDTSMTYTYTGTGALNSIPLSADANMYNSVTNGGTGIVLTPNQAYTISFDFVLSTRNVYVGCSVGYSATIGGYDTDFVKAKIYTDITAGTTGKFTYTFTYTGSSTVYLALQPLKCVNDGWLIDTGTSITITNLKLELGSVATAWTFNKTDLFRVATKTAVAAINTTLTTTTATANTAKTTADTALATANTALSGSAGTENLLLGTYNTYSAVGNGVANAVTMSSGTDLYNSITNFGAGFVLTPNQAYTISFTFSLTYHNTYAGFSIGYSTTIGGYDTDLVFAKAFTDFTTASGTTGTFSYTFTYTGSSTVYLAVKPLQCTNIAWGMENGFTVTIANLKLEKGSTASAWTFNKYDLSYLASKSLLATTTTTANTAATNAATALSNSSTALTTANTAAANIAAAELVSANLLTGTHVTYYYLTDGTANAVPLSKNTDMYNTITNNGAGFVLTPNQAYTLSCDFTLTYHNTYVGMSIGYSATIGGYDTDFVFAKPFTDFTTGTSGTFYYTFTYTGSSTVYLALKPLQCTNISWNIEASFVGTISNLKLEKGSTKTSWIPHKKDLQLMSKVRPGTFSVTSTAGTASWQSFTVTFPSLLATAPKIFIEFTSADTSVQHEVTATTVSGFTLKIYTATATTYTGYYLAVY